jgi:hypothetical protein
MQNRLSIRLGPTDGVDGNKNREKGIGNNHPSEQKSLAVDPESWSIFAFSLREKQ